MRYQMIYAKELKKITNIKQLRTKNIAYAITEIFQNGKYIGIDRAISQSDLFCEIFGKFQKPDDLADELRWEYARRAMHYLRQRTHCFIGSYWNNGQRSYFVVKTESDAQVYIDLLNNTIKRMRSMQHRAMQSVEEEWYKDVENGNSIPQKERKLIGE